MYCFISCFKKLGEEDLKKINRLLSRQSSDLLFSVEQNVSKLNSVPNLHLVTEFDNIDPDSVEKLRTWILKRGTEFHNEALDKLSKHDLDFNSKLDQTKKGVRVSLSAYSKIDSEFKLDKE